MHAPVIRENVSHFNMVNSQRSKDPMHLQCYLHAASMNVNADKSHIPIPDTADLEILKT